MGSPDDRVPVISIGEWILPHLRKYAATGRVAQIFADDGTSKTYEELLRDSVYVAEGLKALGFKSGETVSLVTRTSQELFPVVIAFLMIDVLIAPSVAELNADELGQNFVQINPNYIVTTKPKISEVKDALKVLNTKPIVYDVLELLKEAKLKGSTADIDKFQSVKIPDPKTHSVACFFSSGTTGLPKAVLINDFGYIRGLYFACPFAEKFEGPIMMTSQPYWVTWWINLLRAVKNGRTRVFLDRSSPEIMAEAIHKYKPEVWYGLPNPLAGIHQAFQRNPEWDISSLKMFIIAGDACNAAIHEENMRNLGIPIVQEHGMTELCFTPIVNSLEDPPVYGSIGKPCVPVNKVVDVDTGEVVTEPNKQGELRVQWTAFNCYLNNPEATRNSFDEEGWFKTGDVVFFNEKGYFFMVNRLKDMFKHQGFTICPSELEEFIRKIPGVSEVVVVGRSDYSVGHIPAAFIVKAPNSTLTENDINNFFEKEKVHETRRLKGGIYFVSEIPKSPNGKLLRRIVQEMLPK